MLEERKDIPGEHRLTVEDMDDHLGDRCAAGITGVGTGVLRGGAAHQEVRGGTWTLLRHHAHAASLTVVRDHLYTHTRT